MLKMPLLKDHPKSGLFRFWEYQSMFGIFSVLIWFRKKKYLKIAPEQALHQNRHCISGKQAVNPSKIMPLR